MPCTSIWGETINIEEKIQNPSNGISIPSNISFIQEIYICSDHLWLSKDTGIKYCMHTRYIDTYKKYIQQTKESQANFKIVRERGGLFFLENSLKCTLMQKKNPRTFYGLRVMHTHNLEKLCKSKQTT